MAKYEQIPNVKPSLFTRARGELNTDPGIRTTKETDIFFPILKRFQRNTLSFFLNLIFFFNYIYFHILLKLCSINYAFTSESRFLGTTLTGEGGTEKYSAISRTKVAEIAQVCERRSMLG